MYVYLGYYLDFFQKKKKKIIMYYMKRIRYCALLKKRRIYTQARRLIAGANSFGQIGGIIA